MHTRQHMTQRAFCLQRTQDYAELMRKITSQDVTDIGNYSIIRQLAEGAFGKVYLAQHKLLRSKVVIKIGERSMDGSDDNLMREFYYLREFDHPHITKLYEIIFTETKVYMVLQYYQEGDLFDYLTKQGTIPLEDTLRIFAQICGSVWYIHQSGCCHRDLKLENVLLDRKFNAKLSDLGFTREIPYTANGGSGFLNTFCGTPAYMAPELIMREPYSGVKTDMWALGVMLFAMLHGYMPFGDESDEAEQRVVAEEPVFGEHIPEDVVALLRRLLAKSPDERPSSLLDVLKLPIIQPWGSQQIDTTKDYMEGRHRMSPSEISLEKHAYKRLVNFGIDKDLLRKNLASGEMDSLVGFWELFKEKERKRHKSSRKLKTRSRSMLRLNSTRSIMDTRSLRSNGMASPMGTPNTNSQNNGGFTVHSPSPLNSPMKRQASRKTTSESIEHDRRSSLAVTTATTLNSTTRKSSNWTMSSTSPKKPFFQKFKNWMGRVKGITGPPSLSSSTSSSRRSPSLQSNDEQKSTLVNSPEMSQQSIQDNNSLKFALDNSQLGPPLMVSGPDDTSYSTSTTGMDVISKRGKVARPVSVVSSYSVQSQVSETSVGSGYNTGYSTDTPNTQRPAYARARSSEYSIGSKNNMTIGTDSPSSSVTQLSRSNSTDSSKIPHGSRGRERRRTRSREFKKNKTALNSLLKRGKSPLGFAKSPVSPTFYVKNRKSIPLAFQERSTRSPIIEEETTDNIAFPKRAPVAQPRFQNHLGEINEDEDNEDDEYQDIDDEREDDDDDEDEDDVEEVLVAKVKHLSV